MSTNGRTDRNRNAARRRQVITLLRRAGCTQKGLAERLGVTPVTVFGWVHGRQPIPAPRYERAVDILQTLIEGRAR